MTYEFVATVTQTSALLFFIALAISVLAYTFWPGNRQRFEDVQRRALGLDATDDMRGLRHEQN